MSGIYYRIGDATSPVGEGDGLGDKIIAHVCNDAGGWGRGFVVALNRRWREPRRAYKEWYRQHHQGWGGAEFKLGRVSFVRVERDIVVANMIAQRGIRNPGDPPAVDYDALRECLHYVADCAYGNVNDPKMESIHMPRIGSGLGGGDWGTIETIIYQEMVAGYGLDVNVYTLPDMVAVA